MGVEIVGVKTGLLFGAYQYGENLGPKFFGVPPLIGINWVVLTFLIATICKRFIRHQWLAPICGAVLMVALDFFHRTRCPGLRLLALGRRPCSTAKLRGLVRGFITPAGAREKRPARRKAPAPDPSFCFTSCIFCLFLCHLPILILPSSGREQPVFTLHYSAFLGHPFVSSPTMLRADGTTEPMPRLQFHQPQSLRADLGNDARAFTHKIQF
ncbi:MAG: carotenoid biosynthesis protein [Lewinellaceae bacterium]|nr:carotenoid biosynthesis protein [Lewinellaceae bacterium]